MPTINGTEGNDDGVVAPALESEGWATTINGLGGDDRLISGSRLFDTTPDVLIGGTGNDTYVVPIPITYPIYSTPIIWALFEGDVEIREDLSETDRDDVLLLNEAFRADITTIAFDGRSLLLTNGYAGTAQEVRILDAYGVDSEGDLLAGLDRVQIAGALGAAPITLDLTEAHPLLPWLRTGTAAGETLAAAGAGAAVLDGREGDDSLAGGAGDDLIAAGTGADTVAAGAGDDRAHGGDGDDSIRGGEGADTLDGMAGADSLDGGLGGDTYMFDGAADGFDTIDDEGGTADRILFGAGIALGDLVLTRGAGGDLRIALAAAPDAGLLVRGQSGGTGGRIESLAFADGTAFDLAALDNAAPIAAPDRFVAVAGRASTGNLLADNGAGADSDPDGDALAAIARTYRTEAGGRLVVDATGQFTYRPAAGHLGPDGATYRLRDSLGAETTGRVEFQIVANEAPLARADRFAMVEDGGVLVGNLLADNGQGADTDPNGDALTVRAATLTTAAGGTVTIAASGHFTYVPAADWSGTDSFAYRVADDLGGAARGRATIQVTPVNDAPDARNDAFAATLGTTVSGNLLADNGQGTDRDVEGDALSVVPAEFVTARGALVRIGADGSFEHVAIDGHVGVDSFTYRLRDALGAEDVATVTVAIAAPAGALLGGAAGDTLTGTAAGETILGQGGDDRIAAGLGQDDAWGGAGDDRLAGGGGNDTLRGGQGNDRLEGDGGADLLLGGPGLDQLTGGDGADRFGFARAGDGRDSVTDFRLREGDALDLSALLVGEADPAAAVRIGTVGRDSLVSIQRAGDAAPVEVALLLGVTGLPGVATLVADGHLILV